MATKAERFRAEAQRTGRDRAKVHKPARPPHQRARGGRPDKAHNLATVRGAHSSYELERGDGVKGSSRRSTRKSNNRQKTDSGLRLTQMNRTTQPEARARRRTHR
jgi:hypothetical protein